MGPEDLCTIGICRILKQHPCMVHSVIIVMYMLYFISVSVSRLFVTCDIVYACPHILKFGYLFLLQNLYCSVRTVNYTYGSSYTSTYHQLFGVPQLVTVPRDGLTYRTLYGILIDHMR